MLSHTLPDPALAPCQILLELFSGAVCKNSIFRGYTDHGISKYRYGTIIVQLFFEKLALEIFLQPFVF